MAFDFALHALPSPKRLVVLHVADPAKDYLPNHFRPDYLMFELECECVRFDNLDFEMILKTKKGDLAGVHTRDIIQETANEQGADVLVCGAFGRKVCTYSSMLMNAIS